MSSFRKGDDILNEWLAVADRATPPARAPRGSSSGTVFRYGFAAVVALLIVAAVIGPRVFTTTGPASSGSATATQSTTASGQPTASPSIQPTASPSTAPTPSEQPTPPATTAPPSATVTSGPIFTTNGVASDWKGFDWTTLPADSPLANLSSPGGTITVITWAHGYAFTALDGNTTDVWTSPDGIVWLPTLTAQDLLLAAGPSGLVAIATESTSTTTTVYTSADGTNWVSAGQPQGIGTISSIAGTKAGLVAVATVSSGTGKFATGQLQIAYSADGVSWTLEPGPNVAWDEYGPQVDAANGRFFLIGGSQIAAARSRTGIVLASSVQSTPEFWWSDDGRTWTSAGSRGPDDFVSQIQSARDGLLAWTTDRMIPGGGPGLDVSTDDGKTWTKDSNYGPLGQAPAITEGEGMGSTSPDGTIASNGSMFLALKNDGKAWTSYDGKKWTSITWGGPTSGPSDVVTVAMLPRGVIANSFDKDSGATSISYGAAR